MDPCDLVGKKVKVKLETQNGHKWSSALAERITKTGIKLRVGNIGKMTVLKREVGELIRTKKAWLPSLEEEIACTYDGKNPEVLGSHGITTHGCTLQKPAKPTHNW